MRTLILFLTVSFLIACNSQQSASVLNADNLPTQTFSIHSSRDTIVKTANGALLEIGRASFSGTDILVDLEVKEAYSIVDIINGGLTTTSDGKALSSDGMIYIHATGVEIVKPVKVSIPTNDYDEHMRLYTGEDKDGSVNWVQPKPLKDSISPDVAFGKILFNANCATCHDLNKQVTGPALLGVEKRGPWSKRDELIKFTRNPGGYIPTTEYTYCLTMQFGGQIMPSYPQLSDDNLNAVYDYIKYEGRNLESQSPSVGCLDSCRRYDSIKYKVYGLQRNRKTLIDSNENRINYTRLDSTGKDRMVNFRDLVGDIDKVSPENYKAIYYRFDITSFGWYNIDKLQDYAKDDEAELVLSVDESLSTEMDVFIAVPKYKTFDRGGKLNDGVHYGFFTKDGKLPLPVGEKVVVFVLSEANDKILFDYKEFISTSANKIHLVPKESSKEEFNEAMKRFTLENIDMKAADSKNAGEIRKLDAEIKRQAQKAESWRPINCECSCKTAIDSSKQRASANEFINL